MSIEPTKIVNKNSDSQSTIDSNRITLKPGTHYANMYKIITLLKSGGFADVYHATEIESGEVVALKILHEEHKANERYRERFRREFRVGRSHRHMRIVRTFHIGNMDDVLFYSMELITGGDLDDLIQKEGRLSTYDTLEVAIGICEGVAILHEFGEVHRDLKPANVLLKHSPKNYAVISDFGLVKTTIDLPLTLDRTSMGTQGYTSPEQLRNARESDFRTDIFAIGAIISAMLTGSPSLSESAIRSAEDNPRIAEDLHRIISKSCNPDLEKRYKSVQELQNELSDLYSQISKPSLSLNNSNEVNRVNTASLLSNDPLTPNSASRVQSNLQYLSGLILGPYGSILSLIIATAFLLGWNEYRSFLQVVNSSISTPDIAHFLSHLEVKLYTISIVSTVFVITYLWFLRIWRPGNYVDHS